MIRSTAEDDDYAAHEDPLDDYWEEPGAPTFRGDDLEAFSRLVQFEWDDQEQHR